MKKRGILNHELAELVALMGHGDMLVIADAGLPIPPDVRRIDLAVTAGVPRFLNVLNTVLQELQVERAVVAREMTTRSAQLYGELGKSLGATRVDEVSHEEFKQMMRRARAVVRTGEVTPYANIILFSGVTF
ncbi:MAG: D-ribose pyranase [Rudaea sp.]